MKTDAPRSNVQGRKMWCIPNYTTSSFVINPEICRDCTFRASHNVAENIGIIYPPEISRYDTIPESEKLTYEDVRELQRLAYIQGYIMLGLPGDSLLFNAGPAADNAVQSKLYEIISCEPNGLWLKGDNPKFITFGKSRRNPEWPGPDPITGETSAIVFENKVLAIPPQGAQLSFGLPSVLWQKAYPLITNILYPESDDLTDVEFYVSVEGWGDLTHAMTPINSSYPSDKYYCEIRWEEFYPNKGQVITNQLERQVTKVQTFYTEAEVVELKNKIGGSTKIAPFLEAIEYNENDQVIAIHDLWDQVIGTPAGTFIDLSAYYKVRLTYYAESKSIDDRRQPCGLSCVHSKSLSSNVQRCFKPDASHYATHFQNCYQPQCSDFSLALTEPVDLDFYSYLWHQEHWVIVQGLPGFSHFTLSKRGGYSIQAWAGAFSNDVYSGFFADIDPLVGPRAGKYLTYTDDNEDERHAVILGAFYEAPYEYNGASYIFDVTTRAPRLGFYHQWMPEDTGSCNIYSYEYGTGKLDFRNIAAASERYIFWPPQADPDLVNYLRTLYP